jgi:hypothetical protein
VAQSRRDATHPLGGLPCRLAPTSLPTCLFPLQFSRDAPPLRLAPSSPAPEPIPQRSQQAVAPLRLARSPSRFAATGPELPPPAGDLRSRCVSAERAAVAPDRRRHSAGATRRTPAGGARADIPGCYTSAADHPPADAASDSDHTLDIDAYESPRRRAPKRATEPALDPRRPRTRGWARRPLRPGRWSGGAGTAPGGHGQPADTAGFGLRHRSAPEAPTRAAPVTAQRCPRSSQRPTRHRLDPRCVGQPAIAS